MTPRTLVLVAGAVLLCACASDHSYRTYEPPSYFYDDGYSGPLVYDAYPTRVHYYEPYDTHNVYFYDRYRPSYFESRHYHRDRHGRTWYAERDRGRERRVHFDDDDARRRRGPAKHAARAVERIKRDP